MDKKSAKMQLLSRAGGGLGYKLFLQFIAN
jgi:hypothetical protein